MMLNILGWGLCAAHTNMVWAGTLMADCPPALGTCWHFELDRALLKQTQAVFRILSKIYMGLSRVCTAITGSALVF